jgi:hypothetical protein
MPAVKVVKGNQFHLFVLGRKHSNGFPAGHADLIIQFRDLVLGKRTRKWAATFTVLEPSKPNHDFKVYKGVLVADADGLYSLSFDLVRSGPWPEIEVTFFKPSHGLKGKDVRIALVKDSNVKEVRFSRERHPAQLR